jgi:hypothetical protein
LEEVPSSAKTTAKRGTKLHFPSLAPTAKTRVRRPFTRSSTHKEAIEAEAIHKVSVPKKIKGRDEAIEEPIEVIAKAYVQQKDKGKGKDTKEPIEVINISTLPDNPTFKRLIRQLRDARKEVVRLKAESLTERRKMKELMDMYNETLDLQGLQQEYSYLSIDKLRLCTGKTYVFNPKTGSSRKNCSPSRMI